MVSSQVTRLHKGDTSESIKQIFLTKSISRNTAHPPS